MRTLVDESHTLNDQFVAHLSPAALDHIDLYGTYTFGVAAEFQRVGYQPLRTPDVV